MSFKIDAYVEPHYPLKKSVLVSAAWASLEANKVKGKVQVSISIIGDRKMRKLNREYRGIDKTTDVLAFSSIETKDKGQFVAAPSSILNLGDVVISYPQLLERAAKEEMMVDEMAMYLVIHGVLHLLGHDHEKMDEAAKMEALEESILKPLLPQPEII